MAEGYKYTLTVDTQTMDFKRLSLDVVCGEIDRSSKKNPNGTINEGHTSSSGDLGTLLFSFYELLGDGESETVLDILNFEEGGVYDLDYLISYDGVDLYGGASFYFQGMRMDGSIPGEAGCEYRFKSNGPYVKVA